MSPLIEQIIFALSVAGVTGGVAAYATVRALSIHIKYIREDLKRHEHRISSIELRSVIEK